MELGEPLGWKEEDSSLEKIDTFLDDMQISTYNNF